MSFFSNSKTKVVPPNDSKERNVSVSPLRNIFNMPLLISTVAPELPGSTKTATLAHPDGATGLSERER